MPTAERLTLINDRYYSAIRRAEKHPVSTKKGNIGVRRQRLISKARRERMVALRNAGIRAY